MRWLSHKGRHLTVYILCYHANRRQSTQATVFLAVSSTEICMIAVDTAVETYPQYNLSINTSKVVIYIVLHLIYWCMRLTTSQPSCAKCHEVWEPKPPGTLRGHTGACSRTPITFYHFIYLYVWTQMFCTWVLFLSLGDMLGRDVLSNVMFWFYRWRWRGWFRSKEKDWIQSPH